MKYEVEYTNFEGEQKKETFYVLDDVRIGDILKTIIAALERYKALSVGNLYEICGVKSIKYTDYKYGWTNLTGTCVQITVDGFIIKLPQVEIL